MVEAHYPPTTPIVEKDTVKVFIAGTIDMGNSEDWQLQVTCLFTELFKKNKVAIFNPRRKDWDSSWTQDDPRFRGQVEWELSRLEEADVILMVFLPDSKSPISFMELGAFKHKPMIVYCPDEFYRSGNVKIFCRKYDIDHHYDWDMFIISARRMVDKFITKKQYG